MSSIMIFQSFSRCGADRAAPEPTAEWLNSHSAISHPRHSRSAFGDEDFQIFAWNDHCAIGRGIHAADQS
jgi:hypothetical protein